MNSQDHDQPQSELPGDAAPDVAAAKPRRKRSPRVVDPQALEAAAEPVLQPVAPPLDEAIKPKRSRRKPVEVAAVEDMPAVVSAPVAAAPEVAADNPESVKLVKLVKPRRRVASPAGAADSIVEPSALPPALPFTSATEIIGDLLGVGAFHGQFDGEHAFALPAGSLAFEAGEKFGANA